MANSFEVLMDLPYWSGVLISGLVIVFYTAVGGYLVGLVGSSIQPLSGLTLSALVLAQHPTWTPDQVKRALTSTAAPLAAVPPSSMSGRAFRSRNAGHARCCGSTARPSARWRAPATTKRR